MALGGQTVTFLKTTPTGSVDALGAAVLTETATDVRGCLHEPSPVGGGSERLLKQEFPEIGVSVSSSWFITFCPPHPAALAASASDYIRVDGVTYQLVGDGAIFKDLGGRVSHVQFLSEQQTTGH